MSATATTPRGFVNLAQQLLQLHFVTRDVDSQLFQIFLEPSDMILLRESAEIIERSSTACTRVVLIASMSAPRAHFSTSAFAGASAFLETLSRLTSRVLSVASFFSSCVIISATACSDGCFLSSPG